jgi:hypothetical protein
VRSGVLMPVREIWIPSLTLSSLKNIVASVEQRQRETVMINGIEYYRIDGYSRYDGLPFHE